MMAGVAPAENIRQAVASGNGTVARVVETLDSYRIDVGSTHLSLWSAIFVVIVIVGIIVFGRLAGKISHYLFGRLSGLDATQKLLGEKLLSIVVWAMTILIGIDILGIDLTALAVFSGAFGLAIGFGLQKTFGNLIAGIILLMDRSIKPGDVIAVSDLAGRESFGQIRKIGIRAISVTTRDMKEYLIPNENLMVNQVENWSYSTRDVRVKVPVGIAHGSDVDLAERLMVEAAKDAPRVLVEPEPKALLLAFGENAIQFEIRFWIVDPEEGIGGVQSEVLKRVWKLFKENDITLPFPQRELHFSDHEQFDRLVAAISQRIGKDEAR